ncbi:SusC/RagA family TonB-linked outer membrane protein [Mariniflexile litorale]|uniref:SusC/RagA family TonB-linked outer membrane protein n=1 Tax=Mariniflexile litorale TaxID=3045158 RepID=A0AAU7EAD4_9FLAO|nr:SusC/RagA family TonB-linked outer membrane protein [Mariniflexile sp. KMM 9835]MDQ8210554.1 SusC/RagA family TonB-linked outer membrane protein [Mariniflexile sp. KMM 9835]
MKKTITKACVLLLFSLVSLSGFAQETNSKKVVTGKVIDETGLPLPGVNIIEKGTNNGFVTDFDGKYSLSVKSGATLLFSFVGMLDKEIAVNGQSDINVTLQEDLQSLEEVVVVGYGTQKREAITGSVATVNMSEVEDLPVGNLGSALVGRVLGVSFEGGQSRPGDAARVQIRNPENFAKDGGTNEPLFVIDGVLQVDADTGYNDGSLFNSLDASEVESISFLKDASAAIYGARGAQGVVLVTTKRGRKGPAKLSYSGNYSIADEPYRTEVMSAYEYGQYFNILNGPNGANIAPTAGNYREYVFNQNELDYFKTLNYTPLEDQWSSAATQRHNISASGGSDTGTYYAGISYYTQEGNLGTQDFDRWTFRSSADMKIANGFKVGIQVSGNFSSQKNSFTKLGSAENGDYGNLLNKIPIIPDYIDGNPVQLLGANQEGADFHFPEVQRLNNLALTEGNRIGVNLNAEYEIPFVKGLVLKASYARNESKDRASQLGNTFTLYRYLGANTDDRYVLYPSGSGPLGTNVLAPGSNGIRVQDESNRILIDNTTRSTEQMNGSISYDITLGKHNISALLAVERGESYFFKDRVSKEDAQGYSNGQLWSATGDTSNTYTWADETADLGYVGRLNYAYDGKYYGEFLYRSSASAKFAPQNYWGDFYSLSGGWIISKEAFWKSNVVDYLKFRGSVGLLGKDNVKQWQWLQRYSARTGEGPVFGYNGDETDAVRMGTAANFDVRWSKEVKTNFGFEARLLDNRLSTSVETYYNIGTDIQIGRTKEVPFSVGGQVPAQNYAAQDAWGTEISIGWSDKIGKEFSYGFTINTNWYNSKMIKGDFPEDESNIRPWESRKGDTRNDSHRWGYDYQGMFKTQDEANQWVVDNKISQMFGVNTGYNATTGVFNPLQNNLRPGMLYYKDINGAWNPTTQSFDAPNGIINDDDRVILQKARKGPEGFNSVIRVGWKNFSLNTVLQVGWNNYYEIDGTARSMVPKNKIPENYENRNAFWSDIYDPNLNPSGKYPNPFHKAVYDRSSSFWKVGNSMSYVVRNINLSYTVPKNVVERLNLSSVKLNFVGINPFTIYNPYKDVGLPAPENGSYGSGGTYPTLRTYSLGLSVGF